MSSKITRIGTGSEPAVEPAHTKPTLGLRIVTKLQRIVVGRWGISLGMPLYVLHVRGRRSGKPRTLPVVVVRYEGRRWLVSMFEQSGWVANLRAAGEAELHRGRQVEKISFTEVTDDRAALVAMHFRGAWRLNPFVRGAFASAPHDGLAAFRAEADHHAVFLIDEPEPADRSGSAGNPRPAAAGPPRSLAWVTKLEMRMIPLGFSFPPGVPEYLLEVRGRKTGVVRTVPVVVSHHDGRRWIASMYREAAWVANLRAAGVAQLRRGRHSETIHVVEVTDERRAEVAMKVRRMAWWNPWVRGAFPAGPRDGIEIFRAEAHRHPVFLIEDTSTAGRPAADQANRPESDARSAAGGA